MSQFDDTESQDASGAGEDMTDVLNRRDRTAALDTRVWSPGQIVSFDASTQRASVLLGFRAVRPDGDGEVIQDPVEIPNVRVLFQASMGGLAYDTTPIEAGDTGMLLFADRALDKWYAKGGAVDPVDGRAHDLADAVFLPGLATDATTVTASATARVIEAPLIHLTSGATQPVIKGTAFIAAMTTYTGAVATAYSTFLIASGVPPGPPVYTMAANGAFLTAIGAASAVLAATIGSWASLRVFVK